MQSSNALSLLLVEDSEADARLLQITLSKSEWGAGLDVVHVTHLADAVEKLGEDDFDIVLLDLGLPDGQGLNNLSAVHEASSDAAIVVMTGLDDDTKAMEALKLGAQEYVIKGMHEGEALSRILRHAVERHRLTMELKRMREREYFLATHDPLTELPNRLLFAEQSKQAIAQAHRNKTKLALLFIDLDGFKPVNDTHGHAAGDELLKQVAEVMRQTIREGDTAARVGGDEFTILASPITTRDEPEQLAKRLLSGLETIHQVEGHAVSISASIGIALYPNHGDEMEALMRVADSAMYRAKQDGRGCYRSHAG